MKYLEKDNSNYDQGSLAEKDVTKHESIFGQDKMETYD
jgi:hypothetical protein